MDLYCSVERGGVATYLRRAAIRLEMAMDSMNPTNEMTIADESSWKKSPNAKSKNMGGKPSSMNPTTLDFQHMRGCEVSREGLFGVGTSSNSFFFFLQSLRRLRNSPRG
jgi:hypothetical protein